METLPIMSEEGFVLINKRIDPWLFPTIEFADAVRYLPPIALFGTIINSIVDGQPGRTRQQNWKVRVASEVKASRGCEPWDSGAQYAISFGLSFHPANHGNMPLDVENFVKPIIDAVAAGLFCQSQMDPSEISHWNYDDSNFMTLLIHRLTDARNREDEGIVISVSSK